MSPRTKNEYAYVGELAKTAFDYNQRTHPTPGSSSGPHANDVAPERRKELRAWFASCIEREVVSAVSGVKFSPRWGLYFSRHAEMAGLSDLIHEARDHS